MVKTLRYANSSVSCHLTFSPSLYEVSSLSPTSVRQSAQDELLQLIDQAAAGGWTELDLSGQGLTELPPEIGKLTQLETLILGKLDVIEFPDGIPTPQVTANTLTQLPYEIQQLDKLRTLDLSGNPLGQLPEFLTSLKSLKNLIAISTKLPEIPSYIGNFTKLSSLWIPFNQIKNIPDQVGQIDSLTRLGLSGNQISEVPHCITRLANLEAISISSNQISVIPGFIHRIENLRAFWATDNYISDIPDSLAELAELAYLGLSNNQIKSIPECIGQLVNLKAIWLNDNEIEEIPTSVRGLVNLEELHLNKNRIQICPFWLRDLPNLAVLDLRHNPLPISPEVLGSPDLEQPPGSVEEVFSYLGKLHSGEVRPLNEAKLLLVGQGSVGKTSLIKQLMEGTFHPNEAQTDGLAVREWGVHVNSKDVRLNVWDFGGQEIYHATHQFFLTKRSLYILVCNCRTSEEENRIEYWLKLIQSFGGESPVIIVGNKSDEQPLDINRKALREKYPDICAILETSCQTGQGIEELRAKITAEVGNLREVYNLLPLSWFQVKEQLEALDKDFISYGEYIGICYQNQIPEEHNQTQLIELLHNLGLVLNFRNHPFLQNTNVLNPDWVTTGIYTLLSDDTLKTQGKGLLDDADLNRVLPPERYPPERHRYLTELMQEFQLCFELPDCPCPRFLIPGLLPKEEPEDTRLEGDTLDFQYHYRILPESVLSRFIVLSHDKIHNQIYWRSGVMLAYREGDEVYNMARIKADPADQKIFIAIAGRDTTRRVFLSLIRDTFTKIHKSFADLEVSEWVPVPGHPDHPPLDYQELLGLECSNK